jgi:hypothetical protein
MDEQGGEGLSPRMILLVADARAQWAELDRRIAAFDAEFVRSTKENDIVLSFLRDVAGEDDSSFHGLAGGSV